MPDVYARVEDLPHFPLAEVEAVSKYTSGPWRFSQLSRYSYHILRAGQPEECFADVSAPSRKGYTNRAEAKANARLIAAAPDLLVAAYISADALEDNAYVSAYSPRTRAAVKTIHAAIAKATITPTEEAKREPENAAETETVE